VDTLTSPPVADVLARMFDEAQATDRPLDERFAEVAADEKSLAESLALEAKDYKGMYKQLAGYYLNVSPEFGTYLNDVRNPDNGDRTIPLPFGAHRGNEMSVRTA
jgi:hypothetical protein